MAHNFHTIAEGSYPRGRGHHRRSGWNLRQGKDRASNPAASPFDASVNISDVQRRNKQRPPRGIRRDLIPIRECHVHTRCQLPVDVKHGKRCSFASNQFPRQEQDSSSRSHRYLLRATKRGHSTQNHCYQNPVSNDSRKDSHTRIVMDFLPPQKSSPVFKYLTVCPLP